MPRRSIAAIMLIAATVLPLLCLQTAATAAPTRPPTGRVALVGVPGLQWSDVGPDATPNLWRLAGRGAIGLLSVRTVGPVACPADGWLTVSAGTRSAGGPFCHQSPTLVPDGQGVVVREFAEMRSRNADSGFRTSVGLLGDAVHRAAGCTTAVGPGAALAAADTAGRVDHYAPTLTAVPASTWASCQFTVVDIDDVVRSDAAGRADAVRRADAAVGTVLGALPAAATVMVAGISDHGTGPHLRVALSSGPATGSPRPAVTAGHYLGSASTRRPNMVILPDLTATALETVGIPLPAEMVGVAWRADARRPAQLRAAVDELAQQDVAAQTIRWLLPRFFIGFVVSQLLFYGAAAIALRGRQGGRRRLRVLAATRLVALASAAIPVSTYLVNLVPWWSTRHPTVTVGVGLAVADALVVAAALGGPWRRWILGPGTLIAVLTAAVLALDLLTGSRLQLNSLMGYSPLVGGRYYGMGNIAFAVLATSTLLAAAGLAQWLVEPGPVPADVVAR